MLQPYVALQLITFASQFYELIKIFDASLYNFDYPLDRDLTTNSKDPCTRT